MKKSEREQYLKSAFIAVDQEAEATLTIDGHRGEVDFALVSIRKGRSGVFHLTLELSRDQMEELAAYASVWCEHMTKFQLGEDWPEGGKE